MKEEVALALKTIEASCSGHSGHDIGSSNALSAALLHWVVLRLLSALVQPQVEPQVLVVEP